MPGMQDATRLVCETRDSKVGVSCLAWTQGKITQLFECQGVSKDHSQNPISGQPVWSLEITRTKPLLWEGSMGLQQMAGGISPCIGQRS